MAAVVLGIYGSPRKGGNTDQLLDSALEGAESAGASLRTVYARTLTMSGCIECGGCDRTGKCVVNDDMQHVYPSLIEADLVFLASPVFFYGVTAQVKALIDRAQALWAKRLLEKSPEQRKRFDGGKGYLISTGATKGAQLFDGRHTDGQVLLRCPGYWTTRGTVLSRHGTEVGHHQGPGTPSRRRSSSAHPR